MNLRRLKKKLTKQMTFICLWCALSFLKFIRTILAIITGIAAYLYSGPPMIFIESETGPGTIPVIPIIAEGKVIRVIGETVISNRNRVKFDVNKSALIGTHELKYRKVYLYKCREYAIIEVESTLAGSTIVRQNFNKK